MSRNKILLRRGYQSNTNTQPNLIHDRTAINCDEHIPWFLQNMVTQFPPMERLIDYVIDRLPDRSRYQLAKQLETCKNSKNRNLTEFFGLGYTNPDLDIFYTELPEVINPSRLNNYLNELAMCGLPTELYKDLMLSLISKSFGVSGNSFAIHNKVRKLGKLLNLNKQEMVYITFAYCANHDDLFSRLCNWEESARILRDAALILNINTNALRRMLSPTAPLLRYGIIEAQTNRQALTMVLDQGIDDYLSGYSDTPYSADLQSVESMRFSLDSFPVSLDERRLLLTLLKSEEPNHILLYGIPGTGKTEFMRSLIQESGRKAKLLRFNEGMKGSQGRIISLSMVSRMLSASHSVLVIDECDSILNTNSGGFSLLGKSFSNTEQLGKEWLNLFLDEAELTTIWITNDVTGIHESVKRRFNTSIFFEATPLTHRKRIWLSLAHEYGLDNFATDPRATRLINGYLPSPANMEAALKLIEKIQQNDLFNQLELILNAQRTLKHGKISKPKLEVLTDLYDPAAVNSSVQPSELLEPIKQALLSHKNIGLLFYGNPGTGKTELAKYLSQESGRSLLVKRASDLLHPLVGVSEKLISEMFREAERDGAILLLDEADSLIRDRTKTRNSWEITQTNELLTQIENYKGVLIACTNLIDVMDKAVLRRFAWKVHFQALNKTQCLSLFKKWFPLAKLDTETKKQMEGIGDLSPGDYKAVFMRLQPNRSGDSAYIVKQLRDEAKYRDPDSNVKLKIGFGE